MIESSEEEKTSHNFPIYIFSHLWHNKEKSVIMQDT